MPPSGRSVPARGGSSPAVQVRFYRRLKLQRVYPVVVGWRKGSSPVAGKRVTVRLLAAGAQIVPSEQFLDAGRPDAQATFYVTPLARGWLRAQRLEVIADGRKVQELPLASKSVTHRLTWLLLLLTLLVPWGVNSYLKHSPFREIEKIDAKGVKTFETASNVGDRLESELANSLPSMPEMVNNNVPQINDGLKTARKAVADTYGELVNASQSEPYTFYAFLIMAGLTLFSLVCHRDIRRRRMGKPLPLTAEPAEEEEEEAVA